VALLSHYTTREGLEGIAKSKTFRATSFLQLNDTTEYFYAWEILQREALRIAIERMPTGSIPATTDVGTLAANSTAQFKSIFSGDTGLMYVTSFATASTEDHERRGILTIWHRYTNHQGYCLQFAEQDIRGLLELELMKASYAALSLQKVTYGVDVGSHEFKTLCYQLAQLYLLQAMRARPDLQIEPDFANVWAESYLLRKLTEFCGRHKDPCYEDEREMRIFAFPADDTQMRPFTGFAGIKKRHKTPAGKGYIDLGEYWTPKLAPRRIIIGTRADRDISAALAHYTPKPEIAFANLPVA
jgi:hypothetical protein